MKFPQLPPFAAWQHRDARDGFEVAFLHSASDGLCLDGHTCAVEDGQAWVVEYHIVLGADWTTRSVQAVQHSATGRREVHLAADGAGEWLVDGEPAPHLQG